MFQWDAVDTSPNLGGQNVIKTFDVKSFVFVSHKILLARLFCALYRLLRPWATAPSLPSAPLPITPLRQRIVYIPL